MVQNIQILSEKTKEATPLPQPTFTTPEERRPTSLLIHRMVKPQQQQIVLLQEPKYNDPEMSAGNSVHAVRKQEAKWKAYGFDVSVLNIADPWVGRTLWFQQLIHSVRSLKAIDGPCVPSQALGHLSWTQFQNLFCLVVKLLYWDSFYINSERCLKVYWLCQLNYLKHICLAIYLTITQRRREYDRSA